MHFGISLELDSEVEKKISIIRSISRSLFEYFQMRDYGQDLQNITIGIICVLERKGYKDWFKVRKPKYREFEKTRGLDKSSIIVELQEITNVLLSVKIVYV